MGRLKASTPSRIDFSYSKLFQLREEQEAAIQKPINFAEVGADGPDAESSKVTTPSGMSSGSLLPGLE